MFLNSNQFLVSVSQKILLLGITIVLCQCEKTDVVSKSDYHASLVLGLVAANGVSNTSEQIEINGSWNQYECSSGNCPQAGGPFAKIFLRKEKDSFYLYQQNVPTCWNTNHNDGVTDYCRYTVGQQMSDNFYPANYKILEYDNSAKEFYYLDGNDTTRYSSFVWTSYQDEIYVCDVFSSDTSLANAKKNLQLKRKNGDISSINPKQTGCNSPNAWYLWGKVVF